MAKKLTDRQIKNIIAARAEGESLASLSRKYKVSVNTIKNYCNSDAEFAQKCKQKKQENTESVLKHMEKKAEIVCEILDKYLIALADPARIENSGTREIATALGILIDKFSKVSADSDKNNGILDEMNEYFRRKNEKNVK